MDRNTDLIKCEQGKLILENADDRVKTTHDIQVSSELLDIISQTIQNQPNIKEEVESAEEAAKTLWEVVISPEFQDGIDNGDLIRNECALEIRNAQTGKFVGKAQIKEAELPENKMIEKTKASALSNVTKSICSISGQLQMAEISKKLDIINEKIDIIREEMWREKVSNLKATIEVVEDALELLPDDKAIDRINGCIEKLHSLANFFESSIESVLAKKISYSVLKSFVEGLKFWELGKKERAEYNNEYLNKIKEFLGEYGFLLELYSQTMGLLGTCYQTLHGYKKGQKYYDKMHDKVNYFSTEVVNKLIYVLDINGVSIDEKLAISEIEKHIIQRNIPLIDDIKDSSIKVDKANKMYNRLTNQFNNSRISLTMNSEMLLGGVSND